MKRVLNIIFSVVVWAALFVYLMWSGQMCSRRMNDQRIREVKVVVRDSATCRIVTSDMVRQWLDQEGINLRNATAVKVNTRHIRDLLLGHLFVADVRVFTDLGGRLTISLAQRKPIARVNTDNGYNFYITSDRYILPMQSHEVVYVPVITGNFTPPFERGYVGALPDPKDKREQKSVFIHKLIDFVETVDDSDFWRSEIVQTVVDGSAQTAGKEPKVEIVPRSGNHIVSLGTLDDIPEKLDRLLAFYRGGLRYEGWDSYSRVSVEFSGQVVCTK